MNGNKYNLIVQKPIFYSVVGMLILAVVFNVCMAWVSYSQKIEAAEMEAYSRAAAFADHVKVAQMKYYEALKALDNIIEEGMLTKMSLIREKLSKENQITVDLLRKVAQEHQVEKIWVINNQGILYISSSGIENIDVTNWYSDRPEVEWKKKFDQMIENQSYWIDNFSKSEDPPHKPSKWGYMGMKTKDGKRVVFEISVEIDDLELTPSNLAFEKKNEDEVYLISVEVIRTAPKQNSKLKPEGQVRNGNTITTRVNLREFNNKMMQLKVVTEHPNIISRTKDDLRQAIITTGFSVVMIGSALAFLFLGGRQRV